MKSPSSMTEWITSSMSYGCVGVLRNEGVEVGAQPLGVVGRLAPGGFIHVVAGRNERERRRICARHSSSFAAQKVSHAALLVVSAWAPPRSSIETFSFVTALITSGPVTNMWLVPSTISVKSVMAGE